MCSYVLYACMQFKLAMHEAIPFRSIQTLLDLQYVLCIHWCLLKNKAPLSGRIPTHSFSSPFNCLFLWMWIKEFLLCSLAVLAGDHVCFYFLPCDGFWFSHRFWQQFYCLSPWFPYTHPDVFGWEWQWKHTAGALIYTGNEEAKGSSNYNVQMMQCYIFSYTLCFGALDAISANLAKKSSIASLWTSTALLPATCSDGYVRGAMWVAM